MNTTKNQLIGHIVHLDDSNEFLVEFNQEHDAIGMVWHPRPEMAKVFKNRKLAKSFIRDNKPQAVCCELYDLGDRYAVNLV